MVNSICSASKRLITMLIYLFSWLPVEILFSKRHFELFYLCTQKTVQFNLAEFIIMSVEWFCEDKLLQIK